MGPPNTETDRPQTLYCSVAMLAPGHTTLPATKYKKYCMGLKITACMPNWDKLWTKDTKRPKKPATFEEPGAKAGGWEQKQSIVHDPYTYHHL